MSVLSLAHPKASDYTFSMAADSTHAKIASELRQSSENMEPYCWECGALLTADDGCTQCFHLLMALEMTDPEYGAVHHLTVPAYMLQHPSQISRMGWLAIYDLLDQFLSDKNLTPELVRARNRKAMDDKNRPWSFTKGERLVLPAGFTWSRNIRMVDQTAPAQYCKDIEEWSRLVLLDAAWIRVQG